MSLEIELFVLCEGATSDSRGALALVGLGQNVIVPDSLPITGSRTVAVLVHESDSASGDLGPGTTVDFEVQVLAPDGELVGSLLDSMQVGEKGYADVPTGVGLVAQLRFKIPLPGEYRVVLKASTGASEGVRAERFIHVVEPPRGSASAEPS